MTDERRNHDAEPLQAGPASEAARRRGPSGRVVVAGLVAALALGAVIGRLAQPDLDVRGDAPAMQPATPEARRALDVQVAPPRLAEPAPAVPPAPELEPREAPIAALPPYVLAAPQAPVARAAPIARPAPVARPAPEPRFAPVPPPAPPAGDAQRWAGDPSFDCRYARSAAEAMVCDSVRLAAADRAMDVAYDRAIRAGASPRWLRAEQDDWLAIREDAARHSEGAVADVYDQRISELRAIARDAENGRLP